MDLIEFLKKGNVRVSAGGCWLIWDCEEWVVLEHKYGARRNIVLYRGDSLEDAVEALAHSGS